jgi:outer membrane protein, multidrug efflux system
MGRRTCLACLLWASASGCLVGPNYRRPEVAVDGSFAARGAPEGLLAGLSSSPVDGLRWWTALGDTVLDGLMERAMASNLDVKMAQARVRAARALRAAATGALLPSAAAQAGYSHERMSETTAPFNAFQVPNFPWEFNLYQLGFDASWEVDIFGGGRRGREAATRDLEASEEDRRAAVLSVLAEVARNYVELRTVERRLEIAEDNLSMQRVSLDLTIDRREKGLGTELDVSRAGAQASATEAQIPALRSLERQSMHRLAVLVGQQPLDLEAELAPHRPIPVPPREVGVGVPADVLRRRPDLRRAERRLAAATARVGVSVADLYPRLSLTGFFNYRSEEPRDLFDWKSRAFSIAPSIRWPFFQGGQLRALVEARSAEADEALLGYQETVLRALEEAHDAIVAFTSEMERRAALLSAVEANRQAVELSGELYRQGLADFLSVIDSQRSLYLSEDALARSEGEVSTALVALYKALGGGFEIAGGGPEVSKASTGG